MQKRINDNDLYEQRIEALRELMDDAKSAAPGPWTEERLVAIDVLLSHREYTDAEIGRLVKKNKHLPLAVRTGLTVYGMMNQLMLLCEPKGDVVGPSCGIRLIDFEKLDRAGVFMVRGPAGSLAFRLAFSSSSDSKGKFRGLDLLSADERSLYGKAKPYCLGLKKPTLKSLASCILVEDFPRRYGQRSVIRAVQSMNTFKFTDEDRRRDYMLRSVNSFGSDNTTTIQMLGEAHKRLAATVALQLQKDLAAAASQNPILLNVVASMQAEFARSLGPALGQIMLSARGEMVTAVASMLKGLDSSRRPLRLVS